MSNAPIQVTTDLNQILTQIGQKLDKIDERLAKLEVGQARLEEKMDGLGKRFESQEFISRGIVIELIVAILGGLAKLFRWMDIH
jgi:hypothetical protein